MDTQLLVEAQIDDGRRLLAQLGRDGFAVAVAFWVRTSEEGPWNLYIASSQVDENKIAEAYRRVFSSMSKISDCWISPSDLKLISDRSEIGRDAAEVRDRYAGKIPTRYHGRRLGGLSIKEAYIYPPEPSEPFKGFNELKQRFPSAQFFTIPIKGRGQDTFQLLGEVGPLTGKINQADFEGKPPGTVLFIGPRASSSTSTAELGFVYRPEGWNKIFREETQSWEEVVWTATGKPIYESVDFGPLAGMKAE